MDEFFISFLSYLGLGYIGRRFSTQTILVRSYNTGSIKSYPPPSDIFQFISFTRQNFNYHGQAVQNKYRQYDAKQDCTPSEWSPSSDIYVPPPVFNCGTWNFLLSLIDFQKHLHFSTMFFNFDQSFLIWFRFLVFYVYWILTNQQTNRKAQFMHGSCIT